MRIKWWLIVFVPVALIVGWYFYRRRLVGALVRPGDYREIGPVPFGKLPPSENPVNAVAVERGGDTWIGWRRSTGPVLWALVQPA